MTPPPVEEEMHRPTIAVALRKKNKGASDVDVPGARQTLHVKTKGLLQLLKLTLLLRVIMNWGLLPIICQVSTTPRVFKKFHINVHKNEIFLPSSYYIYNHILTQFSNSRISLTLFDYILQCLKYSLRIYGIWVDKNQNKILIFSMCYITN